MNITEISVKRPAAIAMVIALLIGLGIIGYRSMGADLLPSMNIPVITVSTVYSGAGADDIKKDIVKPIEDAVSGISGVDKISSTSREGIGTVVINFKMSTDLNSAMMDVQKSVDTATSKLPEDASKPVLYKVDTNDMPVLILALSGTGAFDELYNEADKVKQSIEKIPGIGQASLLGAEKRELMIKLDKTALEYYGANVNSVFNKLKADNVNMPSGQIKQDKVEESIRVVGEFQNIDEVKSILVPTIGGGTVRLADIAEIRLEYPEQNQLLKLSGNKTIGIMIQKQSDANVVEAVNSVKKDLEIIKTTMPKNMSLVIADDSTIFITSSLSEIKHNLVEGIITTAIVLFFFLRSWRSSLIVLVAIPTSLIATFFMMYEFKFTLNMMSLMGLSLCIGILVDDSIVVLENIQRHLSMGKNPIRAAIEGRKEIGMAAVAITLCDVVVFAPVAFMSGISGQIFKEFGLTIVFATLFSLFVSFTVTPMLASRILNKKTEEKSVGKSSKTRNNITSKLFVRSSSLLDRATDTYKRFLLWSLENRAKVLISVIMCIVFSIALIPMKIITTEFMPQTDQSFISINLSLSPGSTLKQTDEKLVKVENYLHSLKEVKQHFSIVGNNNDKASAMMYVQLVPKGERKKSQSELAAEVRTWGKKMTGVDFTVSESQMGGGGGSSKPISINIAGNDTETLKELSNEVENMVKSVEGIADVSNSSKTNSSEIRLKIDRLAASEYGVSTSDIASILRTGIQGSQAGVYRDNSNEYDITLKFMEGQIKTAEDISSIRVQNSAGNLIQLNQVASISQADGPQSISRQDRQDVVTISANMYGRPLGSINADIRAKLDSISLPLGYSISYGGSQEQMGDAFSALIKALAASIILVYMILVVLYESFLTPFIRMLSLPCAIIGALLILVITDKSLNLMSMIGLIMLDGLASKNGTLLIDYTNTLMKKGMNLKEALISAGTTRLRPIIMTSVTMIMGMLPSALSLSEGSETKSSMSWVIIGGMIASTILTPIVLPVVYTLMDDLKVKIIKRRKKISYAAESNPYET